jgi:cysteine-rich repeat protein
MRPHAFLLLALLAAACPPGPAVCGNNRTEEGEACDDGNNLDADGCEADCSLPACGNGIRDPDEACFGEPVSVVVDTAPGDIIAADFDGDGRLDLATANAAGQSVSVLLAQGGGELARQDDVELGAVTFPLAAADFDGDELADLALALPNDQGARVFFSDGDGTFTAGPEFTTGPFPEEIIATDLDGDSAQDLIIGNAGLELRFGDGAGGFSAPSLVSTVSGAVRVAVADIDGAGALDLVVTHGINEDTLRVLLGQGNRSFALQPPQPAGDTPGDFIVGELDGNPAFVDLAVARITAGEVGLFSGAAGAVFAEEQTLSIPAPSALAAGDLDGDGDLDVAIASDFDGVSSHLVIALNEGGTFALQPPLEVSAGNLQGLALADLDGDGALDVAITDETFGQVLVFFAAP